MTDYIEYLIKAKQGIKELEEAFLEKDLYKAQRLTREIQTNLDAVRNWAWRECE